MARTSRHGDVHPISLRELEVLRIEDITPGMRRIIFGGPGLGTHEIDGVEMPALVSDGFDDDMRLIFPHPETGDRPYPAPIGDGSLDWTAEVNELFRVYTVRWFDPNAGAHGELAVDFVVHPGGLAAEWAMAAEIGDAVWAAGPKLCLDLPVHRDWLLLVGDETALPAIGRALEELPEGFPCRAVVEVAEEDHIQEIESKGDVQITWRVRARGDELADVIADLNWPEGNPYVWVAGEAGKLKPWRALVKQHEVDRSDAEFTGYWRKTATKTAKAKKGGAAPAADSSFSALQKLHDLADIAPAFAIQTAVALDVFVAIDEAEPATIANVATATGIAPARLARLLRYLASIDIVGLPDTGTDNLGEQTIELAAIGQELTSPDSYAVRTLKGATWARMTGLINLSQALLGQEPVVMGATGTTWTEYVESSPEAGREVAELAAMRAMWVAPALPDALPDEVKSGAQSIALAGPGAVVYAEELVRRLPDANIRLLLSASEMPTAQGLSEAARQRVDVAPWSPGTPADAGFAVLIDPFALTNDAGELLAGLGCEAKVITKIMEPHGRAEDHDYAEDLARMGLEGTCSPTPADLDAAAAAANASVENLKPIGWGVMVADIVQS